MKGRRQDLPGALEFFQNVIEVALKGLIEVIAVDCGAFLRVGVGDGNIIAIKDIQTIGIHLTQFLLAIVTVGADLCNDMGSYMGDVLD